MEIRLYTDGGNTQHTFKLSPRELSRYISEFQDKAYNKQGEYDPKGSIVVGGKTFNVSDLELGYGHD